MPIDAELSPAEARAANLNQMLLGRQSEHSGVINANGLALRARQQQITEEIAQQRFDLERQNLELTKAKALVEIEKQRADTQLQIQQTQQTSNAITQIGKLDNRAPDFNEQIANVFAQNPLASKDDAVMAMTRAHVQARQIREESEASIARSKATQQGILDRERANRADEQTAANAGSADAGNLGLPVKSMTTRAGGVTKNYGTADSALVTHNKERLNELEGKIASNQQQFSVATDDKIKNQLIADYKGFVAEKDAITNAFKTDQEAAKQGVPEVDLDALAQKAIDDPDASDAHKAAARQRLGIPEPTSANE